MKKNRWLILLFLLSLTAPTQSQTVAPIYSYKNQIDTAARLIRSGRSLTAAQQLLPLSRNAAIESEKNRIKYFLGLALIDLKLYQTAAFQFVEVVRKNDAQLTKQAIDQLLIVTDQLGDETLLNYAVQRVNIDQFPKQNREMLYYRLAEAKHKAGQNKEAIDYYAKVTSNSRYYYNALYSMGLAYSELNQPDLAIQSFRRLLGSRAQAKVTDTNKVSAQMGIARALYQKQDWNRSIEAYAKIPRDHALWHDALFEKTWAMLRGARLRSTLSNFHSLHSSYYEDAYLPETLLLRAIVYLYICQYDEMEKVLTLYDRQYTPALKKVNAFLADPSPESYFQEIGKIINVKNRSAVSVKTVLPYNIVKYISEEGDVRRGFAYLKKISEEKLLVENNPQLRSSTVGAYSLRILNNRINSARKLIGEQIRNHLIRIRNEINELNEQASFVRYEMINGKKETLKKKISGKNIETLVSDDVGQSRSFYVENGYEFYPFQGEYWLDEIGNYHYLGKQSCE